MHKPFFGTRVNLTHPFARGLVGCWLFNEGAGSRVCDISGHGNHGDAGGTWSWKPTIHGPAMEFGSGTGDEVVVPHSPVLSFGTGDFFIEQWIVANSFGSPRLYFQKGKDSAANEFVCYYWSGTIRVEFGSVGNIMFIPPSTGVLFQLGQMRRGNSGYIVYNGVAQDPDNVSGFNHNTTEPLYIGGGENATDNSCDGRVVLFRMWNRSFTDEELLALYRDPYGIFAGPVSPGVLHHVVAGGGATIPVVMHHLRQQGVS